MSFCTRVATGMVALSAVAFLGACTRSSSVSGLHDVNTDDESSGRRRPATAADDAWTIYIGGCTGSLISPDTLITANHCQPQTGATYTSGTALASGNQGDLSSVDVLEASPDLDYAIVKVQWNAGAKPAGQLFPPKIATKASDFVVSEQVDQGDGAFTVGFPSDKVESWGSTYAEGQLKAEQDDLLFYNIGVINGNSGGGVWRKSDKMLVSLTNNGPHQITQFGWDEGDRDDPNSWNRGPSMWAIYAQSPVLQDIFPNGSNRYGDITGAVALGSDVYLLIEQAQDGSTFLWVALADSLDHPALCANKTAATCTTSDFAFDLKTTRGGRKFFRATQAATLRDGMQLAALGLDGTGTTKSGATLQLKAGPQ